MGIMVKKLPRANAHMIRDLNVCISTSRGGNGRINFAHSKSQEKLDQVRSGKSETGDADEEEVDAEDDDDNETEINVDDDDEEDDE